MKFKIPPLKEIRQLARLTIFICSFPIGLQLMISPESFPRWFMVVLGFIIIADGIDNGMEWYKKRKI